MLIETNREELVNWMRSMGHDWSLGAAAGSPRDERLERLSAAGSPRDERLKRLSAGRVGGRAAGPRLRLVGEGPLGGRPGAWEAPELRIAG